MLVWEPVFVAAERERERESACVCAFTRELLGSWESSVAVYPVCTTISLWTYNRVKVYRRVRLWMKLFCGNRQPAGKWEQLWWRQRPQRWHAAELQWRLGQFWLTDSLLLINWWRQFLFDGFWIVIVIFTSCSFGGLVGYHSLLCFSQMLSNHFQSQIFPSVKVGWSAFMCNSKF